MSRCPIFQISKSKFISSLNASLGTSWRITYCPLVLKRTHYTSTRFSGVQCSSLRIITATLVLPGWENSLDTFRTNSHDKQLRLVMEKTRSLYVAVDLKNWNVNTSIESSIIFSLILGSYLWFVCWFQFS